MNRSQTLSQGGAPRLWQTLALSLCGLIAIVAILAAGRNKTEVRVISPAYADIEATVSARGTVLPVRDFPARANFTGLVEAVYVHLGQKVQAGQMLVRMKDQYALPRLEKAKADLQEDKVNEQNVLSNGSQEDRIAAPAEMARAQTEQSQASTALRAMQEIARNGSVTQAEWTRPDTGSALRMRVLPRSKRGLRNATAPKISSDGKTRSSPTKREWRRKR